MITFKEDIIAAIDEKITNINKEDFDQKMNKYSTLQPFIFNNFSAWPSVEKTGRAYKIMSEIVLVILESFYQLNYNYPIISDEMIIKQRKTNKDDIDYYFMLIQKNPDSEEALKFARKNLLRNEKFSFYILAKINDKNLYNILISENSNFKNIKEKNFADTLMVRFIVYIDLLSMNYTQKDTNDIN